MLQLVARDDGPGEAGVWICKHTPFRIGRASTADLRLDAPGVWEDHAEVIRDGASGRFVLSAIGETFFLVNGKCSTRETLKPGDEIQIGAVALMLSLAPAQQKRLASQETTVWLLLSVVAVLQVMLLSFFS